LHSLSTLQSTGYLHKTNWYAINIKQLLYQLKNEIRAMIWILGHTGITYNKEVDKLGKGASKMQTITQYTIPPNGQRYIIKTQMR
jgi:hypothetical protein